jgi:predicted nuclease of predicted toxin-antitoxin system
MRIRVKDVLDLLAAGVASAKYSPIFPTSRAKMSTSAWPFAAAEADHPVLVTADRRKSPSTRSCHPGSSCWLTQAGHEAYQVVELGVRDADDAQLWAYAVREGTVILTKNEAFAARRLRQPDGPTIIWLRIGNSREALVRWLTPLSSSIEALVAAGENVIEVR